MSRVEILINGLRLLDGKSRTRGGNYVFVKNLLSAFVTYYPDLLFKVLCDRDSVGEFREIVGGERIHVFSKAALSVYEADSFVKRSVESFMPTVYHRPTGQLPLFKLPVSSVIGVADLNFIHLKRTIVKRAYKHISYSLSVRRASRIICISRFTQNDLELHYPRAKGKTRVIYHGPPVMLGMPEAAPGGKNHAPYYLTFAHQRHKNVEVVLNALNRIRVRGFGLKIVGQNEYVEKVLRAMVQQMGLGRAVEFCGRVDGRVLDQLYRDALGLVFMSKFEGFGLPLLEAMARDCPIIASRAAAIPEVCGDSALLYDVSDADGVAQGMSLLYEDAALRKMLATKGRSRVGGFSWQKAATETVAVYRELLK